MGSNYNDLPKRHPLFRMVDVWYDGEFGTDGAPDLSVQQSKRVVWHPPSPKTLLHDLWKLKRIAKIFSHPDWRDAFNLSTGHNKTSDIENIFYPGARDEDAAFASPEKSLRCDMRTLLYHIIVWYSRPLLFKIFLKIVIYYKLLF